MQRPSNTNSPLPSPGLPSTPAAWPACQQTAQTNTEPWAWHHSLGDQPASSTVQGAGFWSHWRAIHSGYGFAFSAHSTAAKSIIPVLTECLRCPSLCHPVWFLAQEMFVAQVELSNGLVHKDLTGLQHWLVTVAF